MNQWSLIYEASVPTTGHLCYQRRGENMGALIDFPLHNKMSSSWLRLMIHQAEYDDSYVSTLEVGGGPEVGMVTSKSRCRGFISSNSELLCSIRWARSLPLWLVLKHWAAADWSCRTRRRPGSGRWRTAWTWRGSCSGKLRLPRWTALEVRRWCGPWLCGRNGKGTRVSQTSFGN